MDTISLFALGSTAIVGLTGGPHCAAMCGPIAACAGGGWRYHVTRVLGYAASGALAGAVGAQGVAAVASARGPLAVGAGVVSLGVLALAYAGRRAAGARLSAWVARVPAVARGVAVGGLTPLLPCGLSMGVYLFALATGSALLGALVLSVFALGSAPALVAVARVRAFVASRLREAGRRVLEEVLLVVAALVVVARVAASLAGTGCH